VKDARTLKYLPPPPHNCCAVKVDVQGDDVLMQIFTSTVLQKQPGTEAPFLEFIQRLCATPKPGAASHIRAGCGGFGIRNFLTLFLSIEVRISGRQGTARASQVAAD
jgi:4-hydroxyphenylpyruvate dioxygenase-like putative hemolysin